MIEIWARIGKGAGAITECIKGYSGLENNIRNAYKRTNSM